MFFDSPALITMGFEELNGLLQFSFVALDLGRYQIFERLLEIVDILDLHILECPRPNVLKILRDQAQLCEIPDMRAALLSFSQLS